MSRRYLDPWSSFGAWPSRWPAAPRPRPAPPPPRPAPPPAITPFPRWPSPPASVRVPIRSAPRVPPAPEPIALPFADEPTPLRAAAPRERTTSPAAAPPHEAAEERRALDELVSAKRRFERDAQRARDEARTEIVLGLLPVLDNLDRSIVAAQATNDRALLDGVEVVRDQFEQALAKAGLERIAAVGRPFDPAEHDARAVVEVLEPDRDGIVVEELERGYRLGDRIVRAPKVRVGRFVELRANAP